MAASAAPKTEVDTADYVTYAPAGSTCADCKQTINRLEPCRRSCIERRSGPPAAIYRHFECPR
ncbi:hypothetical protein SM007_16200 [Streptomyces avermitilis]|uniref:Uncharacterized protein n=1 Tax=Streptomyces avermitilis TaxID=33903 RepID=A0A4D4MRE8_STRAX|nr:hypothetical protein SM007_16200 [Streptomyces avermitilis]BBJ53712.1 hypothetical protein SAVMC3_63410 [Streptomyces avermitilis]GDY74065.1 hypothetical protein SAV31267_035500 [Streptomyces avermitilis]GDY83134.1 hypothetical protein SAVCW2_23330 [Streptomyces avermitilis]